MAIVKIIKGDLIKLFKSGAFQAIGHGCNTRNLMGAGIAAQIAKHLPEAYDADTEFYTRMGGKTNETVRAMAGQVSVGHHDQGQIFNMYTQIQTGRHADYQLVHKACEQLNKFCKQRSITRVGMPLIGAGIGGLDIAAVLSLINATTPDIDVTIVVWAEDEASWFKANQFTNYGFPRKFDGLAIRTGQTTFAFNRKCDVDGKWREQYFDQSELSLIYENGEYCLSTNRSTPSVWLVVSAENCADANKDRLY